MMEPTMPFFAVKSLSRSCAAVYTVDERKLCAGPAYAHLVRDHFLHVRRDEGIGLGAARVEVAARFEQVERELGLADRFGA
jgi:hypothetical protein